MKLRQEHLNVLESIRRCGGIANIGMVRTALTGRDGITREFYTDRRVYAIIDQLQTVGMLAETWPVAQARYNSQVTWTLTERGLQCLNQCDI
jgi:hypothetical protein